MSYEIIAVICTVILAIIGWVARLSYRFGRKETELAEISEQVTSNTERVKCLEATVNDHRVFLAEFRKDMDYVKEKLDEVAKDVKRIRNNP